MLDEELDLRRARSGTYTQPPDDPPRRCSLSQAEPSSAPALEIAGIAYAPQPSGCPSGRHPRHKGCDSWKQMDLGAW